MWLGSVSMEHVNGNKGIVRGGTEYLAWMSTEVPSTGEQLSVRKHVIPRWGRHGVLI